MNRLKELRLNVKLSMRELAQKTNLTHATISRIESGKIPLGIGYAKALANFFGVSIDYIMGATFEDRLNNFIKDCDRDYQEVLARNKSGKPVVTRNKGEYKDALILNIIKRLRILNEEQLEKYLNKLAIVDAQLDFAGSLQEYLKKVKETTGVTYKFPTSLEEAREIQNRDPDSFDAPDEEDE